MLVKQEQINELRQDLTAVLDNFTNEIEKDELFYNSIKFMTAEFYKSSDNYKHALKVLKLAFDDGFKIYINDEEK